MNDLYREHCMAIRVGQLEDVRAFVGAHPERLNQVRSRIRQRRTRMGKEKEEEEEEKERNSP